MKILITGVGITGKSTLRRQLVKQLRRKALYVEHFDADHCGELRHLDDTDCLKELPGEFSDEVVYLIEDIHGPTKKSVLPLAEYDLVLYLKPSLYCHILFWLSRMMIWWENGRFAWEADGGWQGSGRAHDWHNLWPIMVAFARDMSHRGRWLKEDLEMIKTKPHLIVKVWRGKDGLCYDLAAR